MAVILGTAEAELAKRAFDKQRAEDLDSVRRAYNEFTCGMQIQSDVETLCTSTNHPISGVGKCFCEIIKEDLQAAEADLPEIIDVEKRQLAEQQEHYENQVRPSSSMAELESILEPKTQCTQLSACDLPDKHEGNCHLTCVFAPAEGVGYATIVKDESLEQELREEEAQQIDADLGVKSDNV